MVVATSVVAVVVVATAATPLKRLKVPPPPLLSMDHLPTWATKVTEIPVVKATRPTASEGWEQEEEEEQEEEMAAVEDGIIPGRRVITLKMVSPHPPTPYRTNISVKTTVSLKVADRLRRVAATSAAASRRRW